MKEPPASLAFAVLLTLVASPSFGREPKLNVKAICQSREADASAAYLKFLRHKLRILFRNFK